jgi:hypothetical protein
MQINKITRQQKRIRSLKTSEELKEEKYNRKSNRIILNNEKNKINGTKNKETYKYNEFIDIL